MKITATIYALLPAALQAGFTQSGEEWDNGEENAAGLKTALASEKAEKAKAAKERDEFKTAKETADALKADELARKAGDFTKIEDGYKAKLAKAEADRLEAQTARDSYITKQHVSGVTAELGKLFVAPSAVSAMIASRVKVELVDGAPVVRVLDAAGNVTANTVEDLKKEFLTNAEFKSILLASKGSGGGSTQSQGGGGSTPTKLADFKSATEESLFANANPDAYKAMLTAEA